MSPFHLFSFSASRSQWRWPFITEWRCTFSREQTPTQPDSIFALHRRMSQTRFTKRVKYLCVTLRIYWYCHWLGKFGISRCMWNCCNDLYVQVIFTLFYCCETDLKIWVKNRSAIVQVITSSLNGCNVY
jgi:hypothetical protein